MDAAKMLRQVALLTRVNGEAKDCIGTLIVNESMQCIAFAVRVAVCCIAGA